ncbi:MAG: PH domain-containing protein [Phycisphaerales bacterium JB040]
MPDTPLTTPPLTTPRHDVLREATFSRTVIKYWLLSGTVLCIITIVGIVFLPVWLVLGFLFCGRYLDRMGCTLTRRSLIIRKGILNRVETNIPLEKITDLATYQGPIMRAFDLKGIRVETAGSSGGASGSGALVSLVGIEDFDAFRDAVLEQRDRLNDGAERSAPQPSAPQDAPGSAALLAEIRDSLARIETHLTAHRD